MSAAFEPEMPDTKYIAATSTNDMPPRRWPIRLARKRTMTRAMPVISISRPRNTNSGTDSSTGFDMPVSMRATSTDSGTCVLSAR